LIHYFDKIVGGDAVKISKPNPEIYLLACKEIGSEPENTYAIEDSYNGIRSAHAAGMHPIMVPDIIAPDEEMSSCQRLFAKIYLRLRIICLST